MENPRDSSQELKYLKSHLRLEYDSTSSSLYRGSHEIARCMCIISAFGARNQSNKILLYSFFITLQILHQMGNQRNEKAEKRADCNRKGRIL